MKLIYFLHILLWIVMVSSLAYPNLLRNNMLYCYIWFDKNRLLFRTGRRVVCHFITDRSIRIIVYLSLLYHTLYFTCLYSCTWLPPPPKKKKPYVHGMKTWASCPPTPNPCAAPPGRARPPCHRRVSATTSPLLPRRPLQGGFVISITTHQENL
jgi:hypothetical protein